MVTRADLRAWFADPERPGSVSARARAKRWSMLLEAFPDLPDMTVLDLGGTTSFWRSAPQRPARLTLLNPSADPTQSKEALEVVRGDACEPPQSVLAQRYDLVYSNSTIEHVGGHTRRIMFAATTRLGDHLWVQTPYRYFPIEPHFVFPWFQHLPVALRASLAPRWPLRPSGFPTDALAARDEVMSIELLSVADLEFYFPDAQIRYERSAGLIKSLIALR